MGGDSLATAWMNEGRMDSLAADIAQFRGDGVMSTSTEEEEEENKSLLQKVTSELMIIVGIKSQDFNCFDLLHRLIRSRNGHIDRYL